MTRSGAQPNSGRRRDAHCARGTDEGRLPLRRGSYAMGLVPLRERNLDSVLRGRETPNTQSFTSRSMTCKRIDARG